MIGRARTAPAPIPGPICYGRGGASRPSPMPMSCSGYINPGLFIGGAMRLDARRPRTASRARSATARHDRRTKRPGVSTSSPTPTWSDALRIVSVERGRDPRSYAMVAFGGAGPLHAARLARALGIPTVIVPYGAGVGSAIGLLEAEPRFDATADPRACASTQGDQAPDRRHLQAARSAACSPI